MSRVLLVAPEASGRLSLAGLVVLVAALFHEALFTPRVFFQRDIHSVWYPQVATLVRGVAEGGWPLWNPYAAFGLPLLADPSAQLLYPPNWLNLVLPPEVFYKAFVILHCLFSATGVYVLVRRSGLAPAAGFVGAAGWAASGPFLSAASLYHHYAGMAWMPWVLVALHELLERPTPGRGVVLGVVGAAQIFAGSGDLCVLTAMAGIAYGLATFTGRAPEGRRLRSLAAAGALALVVALLLSAAQWVPTVAVARHAGRAALPGAVNMYWSLHPVSLADLLVPRLVEGFPMSAALRGAIFEAREPLLVSLYFGLPLAAVAVLGAVAGRRGRGFALAFVFFVLAALGRNAPLYPLLLHVPGIAVFRYPVKYMLPAALFLALMAASGMQAWLDHWNAQDKRRALILATGVAALALVLLGLGERVQRRPLSVAPLLQPVASQPEAGERLAGTVGRLRTAGMVGLAAALLLGARARAGLRPVVTAGFVTLVATDLVAAGSAVNPLAPPELLRHRPPVLQKLTAGDPRIFVFTYPILWLNEQMSRGPAGWEPEWRWALGSIERLQPPSGARWRVYGSFDGDFTGLAPPVTSSLGAWVERGGPLALRLLQMGGVGHVVALRAPPIAGLTEEGSWPSVFTEPIRLFGVADPLPRAYAAQGVRVADEPASFDVLADPLFDPRREVILPSGVARNAAADFASWVRVAWRRSDAVGIEAELSGAGHVVLLDAYERGWKARVDGEAAEVVRANVVFRAVAVPAGRHTVEFHYRPTAVAAGAATSALTLVGGLALIVVRGKRLIAADGGDSIEAFRGVPPDKEWRRDS